MNRVQAQTIIAVATQDRRLEVQLCTKSIFGNKKSYRVKLRLRRFDCNLTVVQPGDWPIIRELWQGL
jgi:hypothetical protein